MRMALFSVHVPWPYLQAIDALVSKGYFTSRGEVIRYALRILLDKFEHVLKSDEGGAK